MHNVVWAEDNDSDFKINKVLVFEIRIKQQQQTLSVQWWIKRPMKTKIK